MTIRRRSTPVRRPRRGTTARRHSGNPYFNKRRQANAQTGDLGKLLFVVGLPALALIVLGYLLYGPWLRIKEVSVSGASPETEAAVRQVVSEMMAETSLLPADHTLLFDSAEASRRIGEAYYLDQLEISRQLPDQLTLSISEKSVRTALLADRRFLGLDGSGFVVRELVKDEMIELGDLPPEFGAALAPELEAESVTISDDAESGEAALDDFQPRYPIVTLSETEPDSTTLSVADEALPASTVRLILQLHSQLKEDIKDRPLWYRIRPTDPTSVEVSLRGGWSAHFTAEADYRAQADKLVVVLREKVADRRPELDYVDLRYGERIFFKFKEPPPIPTSEP
jgi:cell division septal protein FtsQ